MRWDNITILQAVDEHQERFGGGEVWGVDGRQLMDEVAGRKVTEDALVRGFLQELEILERGEYLTFTAYDRSPNNRTAYPYTYFQQIRGFALTVKGQDPRAGHQSRTAASQPGRGRRSADSSARSAADRQRHR